MPLEAQNDCFPKMWVVMAPFPPPGYAYVCA